MDTIWIVSGAQVASADCLKCIAWKGRALVVGFAAGQIEKVFARIERAPTPFIVTTHGPLCQLPLNLVLLKNISVVGIHWGAYASGFLALARIHTC